MLADVPPRGKKVFICLFRELGFGCLIDNFSAIIEIIEVRESGNFCPLILY